MPQSAGDVGGAWLLQQLDILAEKAEEIMKDPTRIGGALLGYRMGTATDYISNFKLRLNYLRGYLYG